MAAMASPTDSPAAFTTSSPPVPRGTGGSIPSHTIATPTFGPGGSFSIVSSINIAAPPDAVFTVLLDHTKWPEWNRFIPKLTVTSSPPPADPSPGAAALEALIQRDDGSTYLKRDTRMVFDVNLNPSDPNSGSTNKTSIQVTLLEPYDHAGRKGWRIAWKPTDYPAMVLRGERVQEFVDDGNGGTEYTCWETMYGLLGPVVRLATGAKLEKCFQCWAEDLKKRSEARVGAETASPLGG
ncbi:hypothetical protein KVR01_002525 [Diaporthe batatas]|uniref:uncharacterized protein n=1 Tax=Diaporthe batatas TaxID=748121 RepID=UPI001D05A668|nr:uncharacterized protein KVR01_002525 [Diaporthe batatas]KAG8166836.1 hypothetical protein KVR01_002525 [Diaporthe batatas]